jgi:hypothetical protein
LTLRVLTLLAGYIPLVKHQDLSGNCRREIAISTQCLRVIHEGTLQVTLVLISGATPVVGNSDIIRGRIRRIDDLRASTDSQLEVLHLTAIVNRVRTRPRCKYERRGHGNRNSCEL